MMRISLHSPSITMPHLLQSPVVTLNIEGSSVRLLVVRGDRVTDWGEAPLEAGLVREGVIIDSPRVGLALRALLDAHHVRGARLIAGVTGLRSIPRIIELPKINPQILGAAVAREAKREMPVPMEEIYLSWQALPASNGNQRIYALGVPRDTLDPLLRAIAMTKWHAHAVDIKPLALTRAANRSEAIILDIEPDSADIVVVTGGLPAIMRTVISHNDTAALQDSIDRCRSELTRTIKFYNDTHRQEPLAPSTPVFLTGSLAGEAAATMPSLEVDSVHYPIEALTPPLEYPSDLPVATYAVNIGLALKEV